MVSWGIVTIALAFTKTQVIFYILRFLLGACEAGFFPGVLFVLTLWFPFSRRAKMVGSFMLFSALANAVGAPIGGMLLDLDGAFGLRGWEWVFIVTGIPAVVMGFVTFFYLDDRPEDCRFLTAEEKAWLHDTLAAEDPAAAELVKLRYFVGMTMEEAASALGLAPRTAERTWAYARVWLHREIRRGR